MRRIWEAAPQVSGSKGGKSFASLDFQRATITGPVEFAACQFEGDVAFFGATFVAVEAPSAQVLVSFAGADFQAEATFTGACFEGHVDFQAARFAKDAAFDNVTFGGGATDARQPDSDWRFRGASFDKASFGAWATFSGATFAVTANFSRASFAGVASFHAGRFRQPALFSDACFRDLASFEDAVFDRGAEFGSASFEGSARFTGCSFVGASFTEAEFASRVDLSSDFLGDTSLRRARFASAQPIGELVVRGMLDLEGAVFEAPARVRVRARELGLVGVVLEAGGEIVVWWADITLDQARFEKPSLLTARIDDAPDWLERAAAGPRPLPRVVSLRGTRCSGLTIDGMDLSPCRFRGAHNLDALRLESVRFALPPDTRRWTRRRTIAEEHHWRRTRKRSDGWFSASVTARETNGRNWPEPDAIAPIYRSLRKGLEDRKDEPGAADFYYGEMEMRRHATSTPRGERLILWAYWLLSGYALRGTRAATALVVAILGFAVLFDQGGLKDGAGSALRVRSVTPNGAVLFERSPPAAPDFLDALSYSAGTATAVIGAQDRPLTQVGVWWRIILRVIGPVLIGLTLLSIRGRVKR